MIEIYLLEQLVAFETYGTLSAAAEYLHISQPALSHSMQKLEELMGVPLFHRQKNRLALNENGRLTAEYARKILEQERDMVERVRLFDKSRRTITLGSCAPVPVSDIVPLLSGQYRGMTISSEIVNSDEELMEGLMKGSYQIVVLHHDPKKDVLYAVPFRRERLYLSVPEQHPLAEKDEIVLSDIDGQNILLFTQIGFWYEFCKEKLPHVHFLMMNEFDAFSEVAEAGSFPSFASDVLLRQNGMPEGKKIVPILDPEVDVTYYLVCKTTDQKLFQPVFRRLHTIK